MAKTTAEQVREKAKLTPPATEVSQLRQELEKLQREQAALQERLQKYEKTDKK
jgi:ubiquinone biosynthesis protein UbiJ